MARRKSEPIMVDCEGGGADGHGFGDDVMCPMCGRWLTSMQCGQVPPHQRDDIIARIDRGDFR